MDRESTQAVTLSDPFGATSPKGGGIHRGGFHMLNEDIIDAMVRQAMDITRNAYLPHAEERAGGA